MILLLAGGTLGCVPEEGGGGGGGGTGGDASSSGTAGPKTNPGQHLSLLSLPSGAEIASFPGASGFPYFSMALAGNVIGRTFSPYGGARYVTEVATGIDLFQDTTGHGPVPQISPNGAAFVVTDTRADDPVYGPCGSTVFYQGSLPVSSAPGCAVGWIDDNRVLIQRYHLETPGGFFVFKFDGSDIYSPQGVLLSSPPVPRVSMTPTLGPTEPSFFQIASPNAIWVSDYGQAFDVTTGAVVATVPAAKSQHSVVAGSRVVYTCGDRICSTSL